MKKFDELMSVSSEIENITASEAKEKLNDMPISVIKYIKPGIDLTKEIMDNLNPKTQVFILKNHGIIIGADSIEKIYKTVNLIENISFCVMRLYKLPPRYVSNTN